MAREPSHAALPPADTDDDSDDDNDFSTAPSVSSTDSPRSPSSPPSPLPERPRRESRPPGTRLADATKLRWVMLAFAWLPRSGLEELATTVPGQVLASLDESHRQGIIDCIVAGEPTVDCWLERFPTELGELGWVRVADRGDMVMQAAAACDYLLPDMVTHVRKLGTLVYAALTSPATHLSAPWIKDTENYWTHMIVQLLFQRLQDGTPSAALAEMRGHQLARGTSCVLQCTDDAFENGFIRETEDAAMPSSININKAPIKRVLGPNASIVDNDGEYTLQDVFDVMMHLGPAAFDLILIWLSKKCPKWRWLWNLLGRERGRLLHTINNPFALNLPFVFLMLSGHTLVASRAGHNIVAVWRRFGSTDPGLGRAHKLQMFPCREQIPGSSGKFCLKYCSVPVAKLHFSCHPIGGDICAADQHIALWRLVTRAFSFVHTGTGPRQELRAFALALARQSTARDRQDRAPLIAVPTTLLRALREIIGAQQDVFQRARNELLEGGSVGTPSASAM